MGSSPKGNYAYATVRNKISLRISRICTKSCTNCENDEIVKNSWGQSGQGMSTSQKHLAPSENRRSSGARLLSRAFNDLRYFTQHTDRIVLYTVTFVCIKTNP